MAVPVIVQRQVPVFAVTQPRRFRLVRAGVGDLSRSVSLFALAADYDYPGAARRHADVQALVDAVTTPEEQPEDLQGEEIAEDATLIERTNHETTEPTLAVVRHGLLHETLLEHWLALENTFVRPNVVFEAGLALGGLHVDLQPSTARSEDGWHHIPLVLVVAEKYQAHMNAPMRGESRLRVPRWRCEETSSARAAGRVALLVPDVPGREQWCSANLRARWSTLLADHAPEVQDLPWQERFRLYVELVASGARSALRAMPV